MPSRSADSARWMEFIATWYTPSAGLVTASGLKVSDKVIAVDPTVIPLGSVVEIQHADGRIERRLAADTGGAIKGNKIDIFCWSDQEAMQNGRRAVKVRVVGHTNLKE